MLKLIKQGIKFQLRDKNWLIFNLVFPIMLLVMTSYFMANTFGNGNGDFDQLSIGICSATEDSSLEDDIFSAVGTVSLDFTETEDVKEGKKLLESKDIQVLLVQEEDAIHIYATDENYAERTYITSVLENVLNFSMVQQMAVSGSGSIQMPEVEKIDNSFSSSDYYGVVIITMMILYVMIVPLCLFSYDREHQVVQRICMTGFKLGNYYIARIISSFLLELIIIVPVFLFTCVVLRTNWGQHLGIIGLSILLTILMAVVIGTVLYSILKDYEKSLLIIQTAIIPVWSFLGGSYIKLNSDNPIVNAVLWLSPLRWLNQGIFRAVYIEDFSVLTTYSYIAVGVTVVCSMFLVLQNRRREN